MIMPAGRLLSVISWLQVEPAVKDAASQVEPATKEVTDGAIRPAGDYISKNAVPATKALGTHSLGLTF